MENDNANIIKIIDIKELSLDEFLFFLSLAKILRYYIDKLPEQIVTGMAIPFFNITGEKEVASIISLESTCKPRYDDFRHKKKSTAVLSILLTLNLIL